MILSDAAEEVKILSIIKSVQNHPAQVVETVRHLIKMPLSPLLGVHENHRQYLISQLDKRQEGQWPIIDCEPILERMSAFTLRPEQLASMEIVDCQDFIIDLELIRQSLVLNERAKFAITIQNCKNFWIKGGVFNRARNICIISHSEKFSISRLHATETEGYGVILFNSRQFEVRDCVFANGLASGIYCLGNTADGWIHDNICTGGTGHFNCDAGLHINHCSSDISIDQVPEHSHEDKRIVDKTLKPTFLFVENNVFARHRAQGIYCEGAILCTFQGNTLYGNNKEGICLDWGSALNSFKNNAVIKNGARSGLSAAEIKADFIEHHPMLPDGSSSCKLPGLSIDNGAVNFIACNKILMNHGGGVKMVRAGIANFLIENQIIQNTLGRNEFFPRFHGVYLLGMGAGTSEFSATDAKLDFLPSELNYCSRNAFLLGDQDECVAYDAISFNNVEYKSVRLN